MLLGCEEFCPSFAHEKKSSNFTSGHQGDRSEGSRQVFIGARGFPLRLILSLGAMGWGPDQIQKLFLRRRYPTIILRLFWSLEMLFLDQSPMWNW